MFNMRLIALCILLLLGMNFLIQQNTQLHFEIENLKKENALLKKKFWIRGEPLLLKFILTHFKG